MEEAKIFEFLPQALRWELKKMQELPIREIHLRRNQPAEVLFGRSSMLLSYFVTQQDLRLILEAATDYSLYSAEAALRNGFYTTDDGCRIGVAGQVVLERGEVQSLRDIASVNLRIAHEVLGCADALYQKLCKAPASTLIFGVPGCGKTTLLRDLIRQISDKLGQRVCVADERNELSALHQGQVQMKLGARTDVMVGGKKQHIMLSMLRSMNPQWIAVDEITEPEDIAAIETCSYCGVKLLATAHAETAADLHRRGLYRSLMDAGIFRHVVQMHADGSYTVDTWEEGR